MRFYFVVSTLDVSMVRITGWRGIICAIHLDISHNIFQAPTECGRQVIHTMYHALGGVHLYFGSETAIFAKEEETCQVLPPENSAVPNNICGLFFFGTIFTAVLWAGFCFDHLIIVAG